MPYLRLLLAAALAAGAGETVAAAEPCARSLPVFEAGRETGRVCPEDAAARGLTVVDLSDTWSPILLRGQPYEATYVALANETPGPGHVWDRAREDRYLELFGIPPTLRVVAARLLDERRHLCHAATESAAIQAPERNVRIVDDEAPASPEVVAALDRRLTCEGLLPATTKPRPRWRVEDALTLYQRKHAVVSRGVVDGETRRTFAADSRELDFRALLRVLHTRVIDATGLVEDGSALAARGTVLGRRIDGEAFYRGASKPLPGGVPDLASMATETAALALGWTNPFTAAEFFRARGLDATRGMSVAMRLPPPPPYHATHIELRAEIDRGDVWYDLPGRRGRIDTSPALTLYARTPSGAELALVRWPTTIGGWKKEVTATGYIGLRFKDSDVGPRVWRDLIATPAWLPPVGTPPRTLVRKVEGKWIADTDLVGPGYASAYGLVMLVHHLTYTTRKNAVRWEDNGIRTHGTVSYQSILRGESHGCHRLFNQSAIQLAAFILRHRNHAARGMVDRPYIHYVPWRGARLALPIPYRGSLFELTPPIPIEVLAGTIHGRYRKPPPQLIGVTEKR